LILVDTSALYALLDRDDAHHTQAAQTWHRLLDSDTALVTHNYVVVESTALVQRRLGPAALRALFDELLPVVRVLWVDEALHDAACTALMAAGRGDVSLVDWVSFEAMRRYGVTHAFAFDEHFWSHGFIPTDG
jgi:predicted nucleic acid-binding protein